MAESYESLKGAPCRGGLGNVNSIFNMFSTADAHPSLSRGEGYEPVREVFTLAPDDSNRSTFVPAASRI